MDPNLGRVLVTGATGIVGWNLVNTLRERSHAVRVLVRDESRARAVLPDGVEYATGDVCDPGDVDRALDGCDTVFHAAGLPEQWLRDETRFEAVNAGGSRTLAAAALKAGVGAFVYTSTIDIFEQEPGVPFDGSRLATEPLGTPYQRSKQLADRVVVEAIEDGLPARFVHPSGVYGVSPAPPQGVNDFIKRAATNRVGGVPPGGMPVVYARDLADGMIRTAGAAVGERYIFSDRYIAMRELADLVCSLVPKARRPLTMPVAVASSMSAASELAAKVTHHAPLLPAGSLHFLASHSMPDATRAREDLGWEPTPLRAALPAVIDHLRAA